MYVPPRYTVSDSETWATVEAAGAGFLVAGAATGLQSVFVPILVSDDRSALLAHVARGNGWWRETRDGDEAMALFRASDAYVSPSLYPGKQSDPRVAPTWLYDIVEVRGRVTIHDDAAFVEHVVRALTQRHESTREEPWGVDDAPPDFTAALIKGIVGIRIEVESITGAAKLAQNQTSVDRDAVADTFSRGNDRERAVAARMERNR